jgi:hypothetical protein
MIIVFLYRERKQKTRKPKMSANVKRERLDGSSIEDSSLSSYLPSPSFQFSLFSSFSVFKKNQKANFS